MKLDHELIRHIANNPPPEEYISAVGEGVKLMHVVGCNSRKTKDGTGEFLVVQCEVMPHENTPQEQWGVPAQSQPFNIVNKSEKAREYAIADFHRIIYAADMHDKFNGDTDNFNDGYFVCNVILRKREGVNPTTGKPYPDTNEFKQYRRPNDAEMNFALNRQLPDKPVQVQQPVQSPQPSQQKWGRKS